MINELVFFFQVIVTLIPFLYLMYKKEFNSLAYVAGAYLFLADLCVFKETIILGWHATCVEPIAMALFISGNYVHERQGARKAYLLWLKSFAMLCFLVAVYTSVVWYTPAETDTFHNLYSTLAFSLHKAFVISTISAGLAYILERWVYSFVCKFSKSFLCRSFIALAVSQIFDTVFFALCIFDKPFNHVMQIIGYSLFVKLITIICTQVLFNYVLYKKKN